MAENLQAAKQWLKEKDAELLVYRIISATGSEEIVRGWTKIPKGKGSICKRYLVSRNSEKNNKATLFITNPQIDQEEWPGKWQSFFSGWQIWQGNKYITQTIRKSYYRDIPYQVSRKSGDSTVEIHQQLGLTEEVAESITAETAGVIKDQQVDVNKDDASLNVRSFKDTGTPQTRKTQIIAADETVVVTEKSVQSAELPDPTATAGKIKKVINENSKYPQRFETTAEERAGVAQTSTIKRASPSGTGTTTIKTVQESEPGAPSVEKGHVKRVEDRASKYPERHETVEDDEEPTDQETTAFEVSKSGKVTKVKHTENPNSLTDPTATKGTITRQQSQRTKAGNEETLVETDEPADQESNDGADTGFIATARSSHTENSDTPTVADSAVGTRTGLDARRTKAGNLQTAVLTETSKHKSVAEFVSRYSERETEYLSEEYHDHDSPDITDETADGIDTAVVAHYFDDFLTHHFKVQRTIRKFPFEGEVSWDVYGDLVYETIQEYSVALGRYWNSRTNVYRRHFTHTKKFFKTCTEAAAFIDGTLHADNNGSRHSHTGLHEWMGEKILNTKFLLDTFNYLEPLE